MPNEATNQIYLDKSLLPSQRLRVSDRCGQTVEPEVVTQAGGRRPTISASAEVVVRTQWRVATDSARRARLLSALFGDHGRGV